MTRRTSWIAAAFCLALAGGMAACKDDTSWELTTVGPKIFEDDVYPILVRDCAFHTCHGAEGRFFRVWGRGRVRLGDVPALDPSTRDEIDQSYARAVAFIDRRDPRRSLLLRKPLAPEAGGAGHLGVDKFGRNVYRTTDSQGYLTLSRWVYSVK